jgi:hypothetical protein
MGVAYPDSGQHETGRKYTVLWSDHENKWLVEVLEEAMRSNLRRLVVLLVLAAIPSGALAQSGPESHGKSQAEARALGYMHTVMSAQREYKRKHNEYARSLAALVGKGSFTRRMVNPDRGDYVAHLSSDGKGYSLSMTPKVFDQEHRAFFGNETGAVRVEADKPANSQSPPFRP